MLRACRAQRARIIMKHIPNFAGFRAAIGSNTLRSTGVYVVFLSLLLLAPSVRLSTIAENTDAEAPSAQGRPVPIVSSASGFAESVAVRDLEPAKPRAG